MIAGARFPHHAGSRLHVGRSTTMVQALRDEEKHAKRSANYGGRCADPVLQRPWRNEETGVKYLNPWSGVFPDVTTQFAGLHDVSLELRRLTTGHDCLTPWVESTC